MSLKDVFKDIELEYGARVAFFFNPKNEFKMYMHRCTHPLITEDTYKHYRNFFQIVQTFPKNHPCLIRITFIVFYENGKYVLDENFHKHPMHNPFIPMCDEEWGWELVDWKQQE